MNEVEERRQLLQQHFDRLYRFCEAAAPDHAEDLVQDTLVACLESHHRYRNEGTFVSFMLGVARNKVLTHWRRRARRGFAVPIETVPLAALDPSPSTAVRHRNDTTRMLAKLRHLPLDDQLLLQMHYWDGLTGPALSRALDVPEGTVRSRLRRAKARLAESL